MKLLSELFADGHFSKTLATVKLYDFKGDNESVCRVTPLVTRHQITIKLFLATSSTVATLLKASFR